MRPWGLGVWGPVHPVQPSSASPHLPETGSRRGAIGLALAGPGWVWAWTLGLMDLQLQENQKNQSPLLAMLALLCQRATGCEHHQWAHRERAYTRNEPQVGQVGRWARWASGHSGQEAPCYNGR